MLEKATDDTVPGRVQVSSGLGFEVWSLGFGFWVLGFREKGMEK